MDDFKLVGGCSPRGEFSLGHLVCEVTPFGRHDLIHLHLERFLAAVADASLAGSVQGGQIARQVMGIDDVIRILKQVAITFLDDDFVLQPAQDNARLLVDAPLQREGPSHGHQDHKSHSPESPQSALQCPEGRTLQHHNVLGRAKKEPERSRNFLFVCFEQADSGQLHAAAVLKPGQFVPGLRIEYASLENRVVRLHDQDFLAGPSLLSVERSLDANYFRVVGPLKHLGCRSLYGNGFQAGAKPSKCGVHQDW